MLLLRSDEGCIWVVTGRLAASRHAVFGLGVLIFIEDELAFGGRGLPLENRI